MVLEKKSNFIYNNNIILSFIISYLTIFQSRIDVKCNLILIKLIKKIIVMKFRLKCILFYIFY